MVEADIMESMGFLTDFEGGLFAKDRWMKMSCNLIDFPSQTI